MQIPKFPQGKILLVTADYPPKVGGVAWYYHNLVSRLNANKTSHVDVLAVGIWVMALWWPLLIFPLLLKTIKLKTDVWWVGQVLPVGTVTWLLSFFLHKPYIVSTHGMDVLKPFESLRKRWLVGKILNRAALITANSEWTKKQIIKNYESGIKNQGEELIKKIIVIYPEPKPKRDITQEEIHALRNRLRIPDDARILLTVSRLVARKGIDRVVRALPHVWSTSPQLQYVVIGEGEAQQLLELINQFPKHDREKIHFTGKVSDKELAVYYAMGDAFVLLPREIDGDVEGFCIVYVEADQYGMPVIGCDCGGTKEALSLCKRVFNVGNPDNPIEVAQKICQIFQ